MKLKMLYSDLISPEVSEEEWGNIPEAQEHAKHKDKKKDRMSDLPEHILLGTTGEE
jgi:hypothetical protein